MISGNRGQIIEVGSKVKIKKQGGEETEYVIVGSEEADIAAGRISHQSPIGNALLGKKKGDQVVVTTPRGDMTYKIIDAK